MKIPKRGALIAPPCILLLVSRCLVIDCCGEAARSGVEQAKIPNSSAGSIPEGRGASTHPRLDLDDAQFSSNLPLMVLEAAPPRVPLTGRVKVALRIIGLQNGRSTLQGPTEFTGTGEIWLRGNSSRYLPKHPLRLEIQDETGDDLKVPLLGMPAESDWILFPAFRDKTLMRDVLAYALWSEMGHYAPRTRHIELFLRFGSAYDKDRPPVDATGQMGLCRNAYAGVYVLIEKIKRGKNRLNIKKLDSDDNADPKVTGGYIFKHDKTNTGERGFYSKRRLYFAYEEPKEREITAEQQEYLTNYVNNFEESLFSPAFCDANTGYRQFIDLGSFVDYHWITEISRNTDGYSFSQYFHKDRGGLLRMGPVWDFDLAFGNASYVQSGRTNGWRWDQRIGRNYDWFDRMFEDPDFLQRFVDRWQELRSGVFATSNVWARIDALAANLAEAQERNYQRWPTWGRASHMVQFMGSNYAEEVTWLKEWMAGRLAWIDTEDFPPPTWRRVVEPNTGQATIELSAAPGKIYFTVNGSDPRLPGGSVDPDARAYAAPIPLPMGTVLTARVLSEHGLWSAPVHIRPDWLAHAPKDKPAVQ